LAGLPKLHSVTIDFDFVFGFTLFADSLKLANEERDASWKLMGSEVGSMSVGGLSQEVTLRIPTLINAWRRLSGDLGTPGNTNIEMIGAESIEKALEYLQYAYPGAKTL